MFLRMAGGSSASVPLFELLRMDLAGCTSAGVAGFSGAGAGPPSTVLSELIVSARPGMARQHGAALRRCSRGYARL